jgi:hypothetical protein
LQLCLEFELQKRKPSLPFSCDLEEFPELVKEPVSCCHKIKNIETNVTGHQNNASWILS